jgi:DNA invertase Pin-like site-specific DNA recombinase
VARKSKAQPVIDRRPPIAISYIRFSSPEQRRGDSLRRQTVDTEAWCKKEGIALDRKLVDPGRGAFHGKHRDDKAALGRFLQCVHEGAVPRGSYLIIENLDRLSREDERTALRLWLDILDAGINIVQLHPETIFRHERSEMVDIIRAIIELSRGHSESRMKAVRMLALWTGKLERAREEGRPLTGRLPSWIELTEDGLKPIPKRAAVLARVIEWAQAGYGATSIVKKLNAEKVPAFGDRVPDEENGGYRKADGQRLGCGEWRRSYIKSLLSDRRLIGYFQPRDAQGRAKGEPLAGYYPRVVSDEAFYAARAAMRSRRTTEQNTQGRIGAGVANLFGGLLRHARDGETYYVATRKDNVYGTCKILLNRTSTEARGKAYTFAYQVFEEAVLSCLREIDPRQVLNPAPPLTEVSVMQGELNWLRERKAALTLELMKGDVSAIADALRKIEARETELAGRIEENAELTVVPRADSWRSMGTLIDVLKAAPEDEREDVRLRLRAAIRRNVASIWLLVVPRGRGRFCVAQIRFADANVCRSYLIHFQPSWSSKGKGRRIEAGWGCWSLADKVDIGDLDLRKPRDVEELAEALAKIDLAALESVK